MDYASGKLQSIERHLPEQIQSKRELSSRVMLSKPSTAPEPPFPYRLAEAVLETVSFAFLPVTDKRCHGYVAYRSKGGYSKANAERIAFLPQPPAQDVIAAQPLWVDHNPPTGELYYYSVSSVTHWGAESVRSGMGIVASNPTGEGVVGPTIFFLGEEFFGGMKENYDTRHVREHPGGYTTRRSSRSVGELGWELVGSTWAQHAAIAGDPGGFMMAVDPQELDQMDLTEEIVRLPDITYPDPVGAFLSSETWKSYFKAGISAFDGFSQYRIGFNASLVPYEVDWSHGIYFERDFTDGATWFAVCRNFYTSTRTAAGTATAGENEFRIDRDAAGVHFKLNAGATITITTNIPSPTWYSALYPAFWEQMDLSSPERLLTPRRWAMGFPLVPSASSFILSEA